MSVDQGIRILLVEDAKVMRKMERKTLNSLGFENILDAEDGEDAITKLQEENNIELIISDWNMPNKDGFELLLWVRSNEKTKSIPFLMATGRGEKKEMEKASEAGVSSFIAKPFNAAELREKIEEAFGLKTPQRETVDQQGPRVADSGKVWLNVAHIQITDHLVLGVLKHLIKAGELTPKHFELSTQCMPSWNPVANALENGVVDAACVLASIAMDLFNYGAPIKLVLFAHKNGSIFVRNKAGGEYREPFQNFFRGKSFYIPHTLSIHHMLAHMFFEGIGLKAGTHGKETHDVSFEVVPPIKMPSLLFENPDACGYLVAEPLGTKAIASGVAELQFFSMEFWENHPCCVVVCRYDFINTYSDAMFEFTEMLVYAGKFIAQKPGLAAEIAVNFLDPDKTLGLRVPLLKNVLTEPLGIKTGDLFPVKEDLDRMQHYMHDKMGIGSIIDIDSFVDLRFAENACKDRISSQRQSVIHDSTNRAVEILQKRAKEDTEQATKTLLNLEGKYLIISLKDQQFGIDILNIREIISMQPIRSVPKSISSVKGIINLRGNVVPVIDLRVVLGMTESEESNKRRIIVMEIISKNGLVQMGAIVDSVSEILDIITTDIEETPSLSVDLKTDYILALAKLNGSVNILLDIDKVFNSLEKVAVGEVV